MWMMWMGRNEWGHDSPVFEAVSGFKLSSHLKCYPSSVRGCLTHTAHIKAASLYIYTYTLTRIHTNEKLDSFNLGYAIKRQVCLIKNTTCVNVKVFTGRYLQKNILWCQFTDYRMKKKNQCFHSKWLKHWEKEVRHLPLQQWNTNAVQDGKNKFLCKPRITHSIVLERKLTF